MTSEKGRTYDSCLSRIGPVALKQQMVPMERSLDVGTVRFPLTAPPDSLSLLLYV